MRLSLHLLWLEEAPKKPEPEPVPHNDYGTGPQPTEAKLYSYACPGDGDVDITNADSLCRTFSSSRKGKVLVVFGSGQMGWVDTEEGIGRYLANRPHWRLKK